MGQVEELVRDLFSYTKTGEIDYSLIEDCYTSPKYALARSLFSDLFVNNEKITSNKEEGKLFGLSRLFIELVLRPDSSHSKEIRKTLKNELNFYLDRTLNILTPNLKVKVEDDGEISIRINKTTYFLEKEGISPLNLFRYLLLAGAPFEAILPLHILGENSNYSEEKRSSSFPYNVYGRIYSSRISVTRDDILSEYYVVSENNAFMNALKKEFGKRIIENDLNSFEKKWFLFSFEENNLDMPTVKILLDVADKLNRGEIAPYLGKDTARKKILSLLYLGAKGEENEKLTLEAYKTLAKITVVSGNKKISLLSFLKDSIKLVMNGKEEAYISIKNGYISTPEYSHPVYNTNIKKPKRKIRSVL